MANDLVMMARSIRFEVRYPWGTRYCSKLRAALRHVGFATGSDILLDGSDDDGFLVAAGRQPLAAGQAIMRKMTDPDQTDDVLDQLRAMGVHEIFQDWKHLAWETDAATLKRLGVQLRLVSRVRSEDRERLTFEVRTATRPTVARRQPRTKRARRRRR